MIIILAACTNPLLVSHRDVPVTSARLERFSHARFAVVGGVVGGSADLVYNDLPKPLPVRYSGPVVGAVLDVSFDVDPTNPVELQLPGEPVMLSEVLGTYSGGILNAGVGVGYDRQTLSNEAGVRIETDGLSFGVGLMVAFQSIRLIEDVPEPDDTGGWWGTTDTGW